MIELFTAQKRKFVYSCTASVALYLVFSFFEQHGGLEVCTVASQQEDLSSIRQVSTPFRYFDLFPESKDLRSG